MKRILAVIAAALLAVSALGCSAKEPTALETTAPDTILPEEIVSELDGAQAAYNLLVLIEEKTEYFGGDICQAWYAGIWQEEELVENGCKALAERLHLEEDELREGLANTLFVESDGDWDTMTDEQWEQLRGRDEAFAKASSEDAMFDFCINVTWGAYLEAGYIDMLEDDLSSAKDMIRALAASYPDSQYVEPLKDYYGVLHEYEKWCSNPVGSYNEAEELMDTFREDCKKIHAELEFDLGE